MLQEDSNGETTFEIIDKKTDELSITEKTESLSSMSSSASLLPSPSVSLATVPSGNLLSNVPPPSALPSFVPAISKPSTIQTQFPAPIQNPIPTQPIQITGPMATTINIQPTSEPFYPTQFSAAIPPNKGATHGSALPQSNVIQQNQDSGGLFNWVKGAVSGGGIISKVVEKTKNSVDSMITTLDPQMREYIYSGGDIYIIVASGQEAKVSAVREAFQSVFGKATVSGHAVPVTSIAAQPVGFAAGVKAAEERIQTLLSDPKLQEPTPIIAIENFLLEVGEDRWYDLGVLILNDPIRQINLQTFTQMTPVPTAVVNLAQEDTPSDYPLKWSGLAVTIGSLMGKNLNVHHSEWHQALTNISRRELILLAAKMLAGMYKSSLGDSGY